MSIYDTTECPQCGRQGNVMTIKVRGLCGTCAKGRPTTQSKIDAFKKEHPVFPKLTPYEQKKAYELIHHLGLNKTPTNGQHLAKLVQMEPIEMRCLIAKIRREMTVFQNPTGKIALVAHQNGYVMSNKRAEVKQYKDELYVRWVSINLQLMEATLILENIERSTQNELQTKTK